MSAIVRIGIMLFMVLAFTSSGFEPVAEGEILWLSALPNEQYVLVTYEQDRYVYNYHYINVTYKENGMPHTISELIQEDPTYISISGCGHSIIVAANFKSSKSAYISEFTVPGLVMCNTQNTVYMPLAASNP